MEGPASLVPRRPGWRRSLTALSTQSSPQPPRLPRRLRRCPGTAQFRLRARLQLPGHPEPAARRAPDPAPRRRRRLMVRGETPAEILLPPIPKTGAGTLHARPLGCAMGPSPLPCFGSALKPSTQYDPVPPPGVSL